MNEYCLPNFTLKETLPLPFGFGKKPLIGFFFFGPSYVTILRQISWVVLAAESLVLHLCSIRSMTAGTEALSWGSLILPIASVPPKQSTGLIELNTKFLLILISYSFATDKQSRHLSVYHLSTAETETYSCHITQSTSRSDSLFFPKRKQINFKGKRWFLPFIIKECLGLNLNTDLFCLSILLHVMLFAISTSV